MNYYYYYLTMTSWWQGAMYFRRYGRELVSKPAISSKRKIWGGYRRTTHMSILDAVFEYWAQFAMPTGHLALATNVPNAKLGVA